MTPLDLWRYKVLQTLHDPVHKLAVQDLLRHGDAGLRQVQVVTGERVAPPFRAPDRLATGADRPDVGARCHCFVSWRKEPIVTHPLQPGARIAVEWGALPAGPGAHRAARDLDEALAEALRPLALPPGGWASAAAVRQLQLRLWRRVPGLLRDLGMQAPYLPADSRCPDHSVWDHTRVASAAAFLVERTNRTRPPEREPWMLAFTLGGVQRFLAETRKSRDLWTASMIYADLAWAAMLPVVEELGPDAVLYPDLRGNPAADRWLLADAPGAVPAAVLAGGATTHAAMLPNTFVVLAPRGGGTSGLPDLAELAGRCAAAVHSRWAALAAAVEAFLLRRQGDGAWRKTWARQVEGRLGEPPLFWVAVPWPWHLAGAGRPLRGPALPGQSPDAPSPALPPQLANRERALAPWLPARVWAHYELARDVFWHTDGLAGRDYLTGERGFDYPLVHHQLRAALAMRKASAVPRPCAEPGEKCSLTGREEVLAEAAAGEGPLFARRREAARRFWSRFDAEGAGGERLGSTAAIKRFLVQAAEPAFTATWESPAERDARGRQEPRVPFPSMAAIATASFLAALGERATDARVDAAIGRYVAAFRQSPLRHETVDRRALAALARTGGAPRMRQLLEIEPEHLFPETLEIRVRRARDPAERRLFADLAAAAQELRQAAAAAGVPPPRKLVAVLRMDGDLMSRLILGDPEVVLTSWQDVLHPRAVEQVRDRLAATGWPGLLGERRHMGPALHAAITRALGAFAHRMVGWVVEREFDGRLLYAGGDDLLALLPAAAAVPAAARLQQLFSAPYVLDTDPDADPWSWRRGETPGPTAEARQRFRVPLLDEVPCRLSQRRFEPHAAGDATAAELAPDRPVELQLMLGRAHSLSAGLAIGHYKTPLATLLATAGEMLDCEAKERLGRGALAAALLSGGGSKAVFAAGWRLAGEPGAAAAPPDLQRDVARLVAAFGASQGAAGLSGRLPYKLRERILATDSVLLEPGAAARWAPALVRMESGLAEERHGELIGATARIVAAGLRHAARLRDQAVRDRRPWRAAETGQAAVAGLLIARKLATDGSADGQT